MNHRSLYRSVFILCLGLSATACLTPLEDVTEVDETRLAADYAIPLVDSEVQLQELLGDVGAGVSFSIDPDGLIRFRYEGEVPAVGSDIIFQQLEDIARGIIIPLTRPRQGAPFAGVDNIFIEELRVTGGAFFHSFPNPYTFPVSVTLRVPEATLNGEAFTVTGEIPAYSGTGEFPVFQNQNDPIPLAGYTIAVPEDSLYLEYTIRGPGGEELAIPEETVTAFVDLKFDYFLGYLGQNEYPGGRDTIAVDFFDNYLEGDIFFQDPKIIMTLFNTFGVPARAQVAVLSVIDVAGNVIPITGPAVENGFDFDTPSQIGDTAVTTFVFDNSNSNIAEVLSARPVALDYEVNALVNPEADQSIIGFVTDTSAYRAEVEVELPLYGNANDFTVRDTFPIDLFERFEEVTAVDFRLTTRNGLPLAIDLTGTFLDAEGNAVADLTDGELSLLRAAPVDAAGDATGTTDLTQDILFTEERLAAIRAADRLVIALEISSTDEGVPLVRVTDRQTLRLLLGAVVSVRQP